MNTKLEDKILQGYYYFLSNNDMNDDTLIVSSLCTGANGVLSFIEQCKKDGLTDEFIADKIWVKFKTFERYVQISKLETQRKDEISEGRIAVSDLLY